MAPTSISTNAWIKQIRALAQRKERDRTGLFFVEGVRNVADAITAGAQIELLVVPPHLLNSDVGRGLWRQQRNVGIPCIELSPEVFRGISASISLKYGPQGLGIVVRQRWKPLAPLLPPHDHCWVALDSIQDPGNLGTILRTCDAAGACGLILLGQTTDPYDPVAVRASLGTIFSQSLVRTSFTDFAAWKRRHGYMVVGTSGAAPSDYRSASYDAPLVLLMGSERHGLSDEQQALCDTVVKIPMVGRAESLNVAVATGVLLYEILGQQQRLAAGPRS